MERLTNSNVEIKTLRSENETYWLATYFKLKEYENAEEQGLLIRLPCKVGDTVFNLVPKVKNSIYRKDKINDISITQTGIIIYFSNGLGRKLDEFGKTMFLTEEEAEAALERMG